MSQPFTLYVMQSAHTDIGYTHPAEQIGWMYLEHYDRVLALCAATQDAPEESRFKWTCETAWQVRHYLQHRPEREAEFVEYARRGMIEVTASYLHFTDLIDAPLLAGSLEWAVAFCQRHGLPLKTAIHADINGWPWSLADALSEHRIPYLLSMVHLDSGTDPLGARGSVHYGWKVEGMSRLLAPDVPVRIPQAFDWVGPQGGRVLSWLGEHYMLGNMLGISSFKPFGGDKTRYFLETDRLTLDDLLERASTHLPAYVARMRADGYAHDKLLVSTAGFYVDNSPPDGRYLDFIRAWNARGGDVRLRTCTASEWFAAIEGNSAARPSYQTTWPDHWAHGLGAASSRMAQARRTQRRRPAVAALVEQSGSPQATAFLNSSREFEMLALEHTFDAWSTTQRPGAVANDFQWAAKELNFHRAELHLDEAAGTALRALTPAPQDETALYVPPGGEEIRLVSFDTGDLKLDPGSEELLGPDGQTYPFQRDHPELPQYLAALSSVTLQGFRPRPVQDKGSSGESGVVPVATSLGAPLAGRAAASERLEPGQRLESAAWQLELDPVTLGLSSLRETASGREWAQVGGPYSFGALVHEAVVHPLGRQATGNLGRFVALGTASEYARELFGGPGVGPPTFEHTTMRAVGESGVRRGPVFDALVIRGRSERLGEARIEWRAYHALPLAELVLDWNKHWSELPEAAYVAFPFAGGSGLELEGPGGVFTPGSHDAGGQLPGTCSTYYTVARGARIAGRGGAALAWLPLDAPLVMTQEINYARWDTQPYTWNGLLASMPVNHYWHTNFPTSQRGRLRLRYRFLALPASKGAGVDRTAFLAALERASPLDALGWR
ncbi:hypothetical protein [Deinococcus sp.]|uniref:glycoside hydrolase family 38 N-terminal domain-containing protein n=1 Tax=Deinococcus sp. TaxID=47478 RepID=UPI003C7AB127